MRADSITLLLVGGLVGFAACDGGGAISGTPPADDGAYDHPPSTYEKPPSTLDEVNDYQRPNGHGLCESICSFYDVAQCAAGGDGNGNGNGEGGRGNGGDDVVPPSECRTACVQAIDDLECKEELVGLIDCLLNTAGLTCDLLRRAQHGDLSPMDVDRLDACRSTVDAYTACEDPGQMPGPPGMTCAPPNMCAGCDMCTRCLCEHPQDTAMCTRMCANAP